MTEKPACIHGDTTDTCMQGQCEIHRRQAACEHKTREVGPILRPVEWCGDCGAGLEPITESPKVTIEGLLSKLEKYRKALERIAVGEYDEYGVNSDIAREALSESKDPALP